MLECGLLLISLSFACRTRQLWAVNPLSYRRRRYRPCEMPWSLVPGMTRAVQGVTRDPRGRDGSGQSEKVNLNGVR
jgi:hypothetical protein